MSGYEKKEIKKHPWRSYPGRKENCNEKIGELFMEKIVETAAATADIKIKKNENA